MKSILKLVTVAATACFLLLSSGYILLQEKWHVPAEAANKKNPYEADKENLAIGKQLYAKHCKSCHGKEGLGDGPKAEELESFAGDFTTKEFQAQSDGSLYYKVTIGRDEMPAYDKKIPEEEDRWLIVHYLRTLK